MDDYSDFNLKKLLASNQVFGLSSEEKAKMRLNLAAFVEARPVQATRSSLFKSFSFFRYGRVFASLVVMLLFTGSMASAQTALPGDTLYEFKLLLNEEVPKFFMNENERDDFAILQLKNRFDEVRTLRSKAPLTAEQESILQAKIDENLEELSEADLNDRILYTHLTSLIEEHESLASEFELTFLKDRNERPQKDGGKKDDSKPTFSEGLDGEDSTEVELDVELDVEDSVVSDETTVDEDLLFPLDAIDTTRDFDLGGQDNEGANSEGTLLDTILDPLGIGGLFQ